MKKIYRLLLSIIFMPIVIIFIVWIYAWISSFVTKEKIYHIPEANLYIKTIIKGQDDFYYIQINRDSIFPFLENGNYIKMQKEMDSEITNILVSPSDSKKIFIHQKYDKIKKIQSVDYDITNIPIITDTIHYWQNKTAEFCDVRRSLADSSILKKEHVAILIDADLEIIGYGLYKENICINKFHHFGN